MINEKFFNYRWIDRKTQKRNGEWGAKKVSEFYEISIDELREKIFSDSFADNQKTAQWLWNKLEANDNRIPPGDSNSNSDKISKLQEQLKILQIESNDFDKKLTYNEQLLNGESLKLDQIKNNLTKLKEKIEKLSKEAEESTAKVATIMAEGNKLLEGKEEVDRKIALTNAEIRSLSIVKVKVVGTELEFPEGEGMKFSADGDINLIRDFEKYPELPDTLTVKDLKILSKAANLIKSNPDHQFDISFNTERCQKAFESISASIV